MVSQLGEADDDTGSSKFEKLNIANHKYDGHGSTHNASFHSIQKLISVLKKYVSFSNQASQL
jgi:hypothetical protein